MQVQILPLARNVHHLPASHARRAAGQGQGAHQFRPHERIGEEVRVGQDLEGKGHQSVARQHGGRLVKGLVGGGLAVAHGIVVHAGQIVMHQREGVHRLNRQRGAQRGFAAHPVQFGHGHQQQRTQPLAPTDRGMAHRLEEPCAAIVRHRQQGIEARIDVRSDSRQGLAQQGRACRCRTHRSAPRFGIERHGGFRLAAGPGDDPLDPRLGGIKPRLAMRAQGFTAFVQSDRIVERDFAAFEPPHHVFERAQRLFKRHTGDFRCTIGHAAEH